MLVRNRLMITPLALSNEWSFPDQWQPISRSGLAALFLLIGTGAIAAGSKNECAELSGDAAIAACSKAIDENPADPFPYFYRGVEYLNHGDLDRSVADYDKAITLNPKIALFYNNRGNAFRIQGDFRKALADYNEAIKLNPGLGSAYQNRAHYFRDRGEYDRAIGDYNQAIRLYPQDSVALHGRCRTFAIANTELRQALDDCEAALRIAPADLGILESRGLVYLRLRAFDRAAADFGVVIASNPKHAASSLYGRGLARRGLGDDADAAADIAAAKLIESDIEDQFARYLRP